MLKKTKTALFKERFETWKYGCALESICNYFGFSKKVRFYEEKNKEINTIRLNSDKILRGIFYSVWDRYKELNDSELIHLNCANGTAWDIANKNKSPFIEFEYILKEGE